MSKSKKRRSRGRPVKRGGVMLGMRRGFRDMTGAAAGAKTSGKSTWVGPVVTVLLIVAAVALLMSLL